ncbi:MAG: hypothetical protein OEL87_00030 [Nanoarchaeota archaeon]|nr:hypothetical protein [Nanoarchaeota archaeon]
MDNVTATAIVNSAERIAECISLLLGKVGNLETSLNGIEGAINDNKDELEEIKEHLRLIAERTGE